MTYDSSRLSAVSFQLSAKAFTRWLLTADNCQPTTASQAVPTGRRPAKTQQPRPRSQGYRVRLQTARAQVTLKSDELGRTKSPTNRFAVVAKTKGLAPGVEP